MQTSEVPDMELDDNGDFVVKESASGNILFGLLFVILAVAITVNERNDDIRDNVHRPFVKAFMALIMLMPASAFIIKAFLKRNVLTVNKTGIYHFGTLKTTWANLINAQIIPNEYAPRRNFNYFLVLYFYKDAVEGCFETKIPWDSSFNKSEEEIMGAIKYFVDKHLEHLNGK